MLHDLGWLRSGPGSIVLRIALFARLLRFILRLFHLRFDEGWWWRFLLLQLLDTPLGYPQLLPHFLQALQGFLELGF